MSLQVFVTLLESDGPSLLSVNRIIRHRQQRRRLAIILTFTSTLYLLFIRSNHHNHPFIQPLQSPDSSMTGKIISVQEVENHKDEKSAWVIVEGKVYDVTDFLEDHPGGKKILLKSCGKDATELFHQYHTNKILKTVAGPMMIGQVTSDAKL
ncbi:hypothetical protein PCASD_07770 [Puccinia coronata f. sp. avenae]|uniref:Cytochrome b5 heme-binding domain-containing protein n=1 Tax=Puccinia coronata f. sp. avenae TaxID=200324 RepID=A0A2N5US31_9BASI|nr:hypothetical protein PCASD_07770 [Puccinia coronata f. sp. avenae]